LRTLLDGTLPTAEQNRLTGHLEACASCQQQLEALSAQDALCPEMAQQLGRGPPRLEPGLREALDRLKGEAETGEATTEPDGADDLSLDFLSPPNGPGQLGRIGHYAVLEVVGRGGMGVVLRAFDEQLHRVVAVKVMATQFAANATARKRFTREAQATAAIRDEQVISIHAVEETNRLPYLVMDYIHGISLQERLDRAGPLALEQVVRIGLQIARGLAAAHAQGLIHRDIKPANILLENGVERVKITDFGLARAVDDASLTQSGVVAGTPHYMAPEQARGEPADPRADLFSLGGVLYAMCAGHPPFRARGSLAVLKRVCEDTPRPVREISPETPDWLAALIARLLAKDPAERFQSATEVAELLSQQLARLQQPLSLVPESATAPPAAGKARRGRWPLAATAFLLLGGLGVSEATGVTQIVPTVIRIFTAEGTLVVDVNDPGVKVAIEGDGGLVIRGAGVHEVRLRPGSYRVQASKDGKPFQSEQVTISRGTNQSVKVRWEEAKAAVRLPSAEEKREQAQQQDEEAGKLARQGQLLRTSDPAQAAVHFRSAAALYEKLVQGAPEARTYQRQLEACRWGLGSALNLQVARLVHRRAGLSDTERQRALVLAKEAVSLLPSEGGYWSNLGLAHYRAYDWEAARNVLEKTEQIALTPSEPYPTGYSRFILAMIHWQRGDKERARRCYDQAAGWMEKHRPTDSQLLRLQAEARELLQVSKSP